MDDQTLNARFRKPARLRLHPLAGAVLLAVLGSTLIGCAGSGPLQGDEAVTGARSAYARQDYRKAAELLSVPAMQGDAEAQYALGYLYYYGRGVRKDQRRARAWFEDAARLGHAGAQRALRLLSVYAQMPPLPGETATPSAETPAAGGEPDALPLNTSVAPAPVASGPEPTRPSEPSPIGGPRVQTTDAASPPPAASALPVEAAPVPVPEAQDDTQVAPAQPVAPETPPPAPPTRTLQPVHAPANTPTPAIHAAAPSPLLKATWTESPAPSLQRASAKLAPVAVSPVDAPANADARPRYTIHLLSSRSRADLERLVEAHGLEHARYYMVKRSDGHHYRLIYGGFDSVAAARRAIDALPAALHAHQPWVNNYPADVEVTGLRTLL